MGGGGIGQPSGAFPWVTARPGPTFPHFSLRYSFPDMATLVCLGIGKVLLRIGAAAPPSF